MRWTTESPASSKQAQLYMSSTIGDDERFKDSATRPSSDLVALVERFRRYGHRRSDHDVTHCACGLQFVVTLTVLLETTQQQTRMFTIIILIIVMRLIEHGIVGELASEGQKDSHLTILAMARVEKRKEVLLDSALKP